MDPHLEPLVLSNRDQLTQTAKFRAAQLREQWNHAQDFQSASEACAGLMSIAANGIDKVHWKVALPHVSAAIKVSGALGNPFAAQRLELLDRCLKSAALATNWKQANDHPDHIRVQMLLHLNADHALSPAEFQNHLRPALVRLAGTGSGGQQAAQEAANLLASSHSPEIAEYGQKMQLVVGKTIELRKAQEYFNDVIKQHSNRVQSEMTLNEQISLQVNDRVLPLEVHQQLRLTATAMGTIALQCAEVDPVAALPLLREVSGLIRTALPEQEQAEFLEHAIAQGVAANDPPFVLQMAARRVALPNAQLTPLVSEAFTRCIEQRQQELQLGIDPDKWTPARHQMQCAVELIEGMARSPNPELVLQALNIAKSDPFFQLEKSASARIVLDIASLHGTTQTFVDATTITNAGTILLSEGELDGAMEAVSLLQNLAYDTNSPEPHAQALGLMKGISTAQKAEVWRMSPLNPERDITGEEWSEESTVGMQLSEFDALNEVAVSLQELGADPTDINDLRHFGAQQALACAQEHATNGDWSACEELAGMMDELQPGNHAEQRRLLAQTALQSALADPSGDLGPEEDLTQRLEAIEAALALADPTDVTTREEVLNACDQFSHHSLLQNPSSSQELAVAKDLNDRIAEIRVTAQKPSAPKQQLYQQAGHLEYPSAKALAFCTEGRLRPEEAEKVKAFSMHVAQAVEQAYNELSLMNVSDWDGKRAHLNNLGTMQATWAESGLAVDNKINLNDDARGALYFELLRLDDDADFQPSRNKATDPVEKKYFDKLRNDCATAYPPDGYPDEDPAKRQKFIELRTEFHSDPANSNVTSLASGKGLSMLSARAGYLIEERAYQLMSDRGVLGWDDQNTEVLGKGTRPDVTLPLGGNRYALLDINASESTGHILKKSPSWTDKARIPAAIEVTYPSFDSKLLVSHLLEKKAQFPSHMAEQREQHLQLLQQQQDDKAEVLNWLRDLRDNYSQSALNKVTRSQKNSAHLAATLGLTTGWKGLPKKLPSPPDPILAGQAMEALERKYGPNPISRRNAQSKSVQQGL